MPEKRRNADPILIRQLVAGLSAASAPRKEGKIRISQPFDEQSRGTLSWSFFLRCRIEWLHFTHRIVKKAPFPEKCYQKVGAGNWL
jgi:hypothetical protein